MKTTRRGRGSRRVGQPPGHLQHHRRPRGVVVGAVVDVAREERERARAAAAAAQVVVVAADDDRLVGLRARALRGRRPRSWSSIAWPLDRRPAPRASSLQARASGASGRRRSASPASASDGSPAAASSLSAKSRVTIDERELRDSARSPAPVKLSSSSLSSPERRRGR